jgi:AraC family transcriptional regulator
MTSPDSRSEYEARMHRVLEHIDQHLEQPLDLATLAAVARFSPFHFHRLFSAWMGETLGDYLRRRRVEVAAMRLAAQPRMKILPLALSVGFGSAEAFTRAFKGRFGSSPSVWREQRATLCCSESNPGQVESKGGQVPDLAFPHHAVSPKLDLEFLMKVKVIDRAPATVAYLRHMGPYGPSVVRFWQEKYIPWAVMNKLASDHARYGIAHDDPSITAPAKCRYDACAELAPDFAPIGGALIKTIPGGKYAVLSFHGSVAQVKEAWAALLRDWLPSSGMELDTRPCFEYYPKGAKCDVERDDFECEICIPVVPLR